MKKIQYYCDTCGRELDYNRPGFISPNCYELSLVVDKQVLTSLNDSDVHFSNSRRKTQITRLICPECYKHIQEILNNLF